MSEFAEIPADVYRRLGRMLSHPPADLVVEADRTAAALRDVAADSARALDAFASEVRALERDQLEELHLRTFVLSPSCVPYVGVHLYGEESFHRGELMARLRGGFAAHGFAPAEELPDHVAELLSFAASTQGEERAELETWLLALPVRAMAASLEGTGNPYRHLIEAIAALVGRRGVPDEVLEIAASRTRHANDGFCGSCTHTSSKE